MKTILLSICKKRLAILWFLIGGLLFISFLFQFLNGAYSGEEKKAWNWLVQNIFPTASLIIGVFALDSLSKEKQTRAVEKLYYRMAFWFSFFYLFIILLTLLYRPFTDYSHFEILEISNLYLAPLQGLVTAALGIFFFKSAPQKEE